MISKKIIIIGTGVGGLVAANILSKKGFKVEIYEKNKHPGGKLRSVESKYGQIDAGPTVFTFKEIFEKIFQLCGENIDDHLDIEKEPIIARHFWPDGSFLDLFDNFEKNCDGIYKLLGKKSKEEFIIFNNLSKELFETFNEPIINNPNPKLLDVSLKTFKKTFKLYNLIKPNQSLWNFLDKNFSEPKLKQLFARYATYVGGSPFSSPAILALIWEAETKGIWRINGGLHLLAKKLTDLAKKNGAKFFFNTNVKKINFKNNFFQNIVTQGGEKKQGDLVIFNGDPRALHFDLANKEVSKKVLNKYVLNTRSLSAYVWSFCSQINNFELQHHNIFFNENYKSEFQDIQKNLMPSNPTLYLCAEDRGSGKKIIKNEKFEIIMNGAPYEGNTINEKEEFQQCYSTTFSKLEQIGLTFKTKPTMEMLTTPKKFDKMFPKSKGSLYGQNPNSMMTTFRRPKIKTKIPNLFLVGGGVHPGPGIPMAALSGMHAAEEIVKNQTLI